MTTSAHTPPTYPLKGWRAHAWAWVLFVALFKGLVPHAALASVVMEGSPALVWCAPGTSSATADGKGAAGMAAAAHACVCASAADGALPLDRSAAHFLGPSLVLSARQLPAAPTLVLSRPPPARGPPVL